jgi:hypothetical protein
MSLPDDKEVVALALALMEVAGDEGMGARGLRFMCLQAAKMIRDLRPDLAFVNSDNG